MNTKNYKPKISKCKKSQILKAAAMYAIFL